MLPPGGGIGVCMSIARGSGQKTKTASLAGTRREDDRDRPPPAE